VDEELHVGERFVAALAAGDLEGLRPLLDARARFRGLVPGGLREYAGADAVVEQLRAWFGRADELEVRGTSVDAVLDRVRLRYRFRLRPHPDHAGSGWHQIEQVAFCDVDAGRIVAIDLLCSGFRPEPSEASGGVHSFDAGDIGCGEGLPQEFRRRIAAIPVGEVLEVVARDPTARHDLPSLARLLGHRIRSTEEAGDAFVIRVERGK
jgi:TusA-related sulfurtransferase